MLETGELSVYCGDINSAIMSLKVDVPSLVGMVYEDYKHELAVWRGLTDLPKKKQGGAVALSLPREGFDNIRKNVFKNVAQADMEKDDGYETVVKYMDQHLKKDDLEDTWEKYADFEACKKKKE